VRSGCFNLVYFLVAQAAQFKARASGFFMAKNLTCSGIILLTETKG
jgi:hypothetical protein